MLGSLLSFLPGRHATRRRGVSIESVLLGVILVLFMAGTVMFLFNMAQRYINLGEASRVLPMVSAEARRLFQDAGSYGALNNRVLIDAGMIPPNMLEEERTSDTITLPYEGRVRFGPAPDPSFFEVRVDWATSGFNARSLCTRLTQLPEDGDAFGVLGFLYEIESAQCQSGTPSFIAIYERE